MDLGRVGVWWSGSLQVEGDASIDVAAELETLGYGTIWSSGGFRPGLSSRFQRVLESTKHVAVASGIVSVWTGPAGGVADAVAELESKYPGRFLLGLGASHGPAVEGYNRPYSHVVEYLDALDGHQPTVAKERRALAALGPRMLELAASRTAGAHPYFVPVEHTARAREIMGPGPTLAPEVTVVIEADAVKARELARTFTPRYLALPNYANNLRSLGFSEEDLAGAGSDRVVDAVVAWGDVDAVAGRVRDHLDAGADHVCVQVVGGADGFPLTDYRELAAALQLS